MGPSRIKESEGNAQEKESLSLNYEDSVRVSCMKAWQKYLRKEDQKYIPGKGCSNWKGM